MEGGLCSNLFQLASGNNGAWGAVCFTCNKGNAIKLANMGRPGSDIFLSFRAHLNSSTVTLKRKSGTLGISVDPNNHQITNVVEGGAGDTAGLCVGDFIAEVSTASRRPAAPLASCCLLQRWRRLGCGSSECRWLTPAIYTSLAYEHKCLPSPSHTGLTLLSALAPSSPPREDQACPRAAGALQTARRLRAVGPSFSD